MFVWLERCLSCQSTGCSCRASGLGSQYPHGGSSSRWSDSLFCPHPALHTSGTYTYMDTNMQTYKIHNKSYKCSVEPHIIFYIFATKYLFYALIHSCRTDIPIVEKFTEMNRFGVWLILVWFYCWWYCFASIFIIITRRFKFELSLLLYCSLPRSPTHSLLLSLFLPSSTSSGCMTSRKIISQFWSIS